MAAATSAPGQSLIQGDWRHSNTPSMTSASSVYDDDSVESPPEPWQQVAMVDPRDKLGREKQTQNYPAGPVATEQSWPSRNPKDLPAQRPSRILQENTPHDLALLHLNTRLGRDRSSSSLTINSSSTSPTQTPAVPAKDVRRSPFLKSTNNLKAAAMNSLRGKGSRKDLVAANSPASPKDKDNRVIGSFSTSGSAFRVATRESSSTDHMENRETRNMIHPTVRGPILETPISPVRHPSPDSHASSSDQMLSRIGRNIARRSVQVKNQLVGSEDIPTDTEREPFDINRPTLTLEIPAAPQRSEHGRRLANDGPVSDLAPLPARSQGHERNASSIYSVGSSTLAAEQYLSPHSTTLDMPSQSPTFAPRTSIIPAPRKIPYDAFDIPPPPLTDAHFMCYQSHVSMRPSPNRHAPVPCMACWTVDSEERWRCTFCAMRICQGCADRLWQDPARSLGRLVEMVEKRGRSGRGTF